MWKHISWCVLSRCLAFNPRSETSVSESKNTFSNPVCDYSTRRRQSFRASRWIATLMFDLWFKLFCWVSPVLALNSTALKAITTERNPAFQLQLGCIAVSHVSNDYRFYLNWIAKPARDRYRRWSSHFRDALLKLGHLTRNKHVLESHTGVLLYASYVRMCKIDNTTTVVSVYFDIQQPKGKSIIHHMMNQ